MRVSYFMHIILAVSLWMPTRLHCSWIEVLINAGVNLRVRLERGVVAVALLCRQIGLFSIVNQLTRPLLEVTGYDQS
jgi:hypothetical protein